MDKLTVFVVLQRAMEHRYFCEERCVNLKDCYADLLFDYLNGDWYV